ncbi:MAG: cytochrome c oxidase subunit 3 [Syntrophobacteraceae bacterium]|nr:cytochrome c oxidase subunit 3 [Syntrophobacteraceae bacterium]
MNKTRLAMLLFVASEAVFFIVLILAYVLYHATSPSAADASRYLDIPKTAVFTACLLLSSFTMRQAAVFLRTGRRKPALAWLLATVALGAVFLAGQGAEYVSLIGKGMTVSRDLFGTTFFTLTGFHGLHVFIGLIMLGTLFGLELKGGAACPAEAVECVSIYWHFVDAVWMIIFPLVYLWVLR